MDLNRVRTGLRLGIPGTTPPANLVELEEETPGIRLDRRAAPVHRMQPLDQAGGELECRGPCVAGGGVSGELGLCEGGGLGGRGGEVAALAEGERREAVEEAGAGGLRGGGRGGGGGCMV
jgi:hypothetical protein